MHPLVRDGDILTVEAFNAGSPKRGDVVLCTNQAEKVLVHRVIAKQTSNDGAYFLIKGDNSLKPDGWFLQDQILGVVSAIDRGSNHINMRNIMVRALGRFAAARSQSRVGFGKIGHLVVKLIRALPVFSSLLS